MTHITELSCACRECRLEVEGKPIVTAECHCDSCRSAAARLGALPGAPSVLEPNGGTRFALYRKDRIRFKQGTAQLKEHRLTPKSPTRRVVAGCCNTPMFLEFQSGHWLSVYTGLWPTETRPPLEVRTMIMDRPPGAPLENDVPNARRQSPSFMLRLLGAWIAMGFRSPKIEVQGALHA
jgi:hypothetical protein